MSESAHSITLEVFRLRRKGLRHQHFLDSIGTRTVKRIEQGVRRLERFDDAKEDIQIVVCKVV